MLSLTSSRVHSIDSIDSIDSIQNPTPLMGCCTSDTACAERACTTISVSTPPVVFDKRRPLPSPSSSTRSRSRAPVLLRPSPPPHAECEPRRRPRMHSFMDVTLLPHQLVPGDGSRVIAPADAMVGRTSPSPLHAGSASSTRDNASSNSCNCLRNLRFSTRSAKRASSVERG